MRRLPPTVAAAPAGAAVAVRPGVAATARHGRTVRHAPPRAAPPLATAAIVALLAALVAGAGAASRPAAALPFPFNAWQPHLPDWAERWLYNPRERTSEAIAAAQRHDDKAAVPFADSALRVDPTSPLAQYNDGTAKLAAGDGRAAATVLDQSSKGAAPDLAPAAHYNLGNAHFAAGDYAGAVEAYKQTLRATPGNSDAKFNLELALRGLQKQQQGGSRSAGPRNGGNRPRQGEQQQKAGQGGNGNPGTSPQNGQSQQSANSQQQGQRQGQHGEQQGQTRGPQGLPQQLPGHQPLSGYRDQPEMSAAEAAAVLESVQNMERQQRRLAAAKQLRQRAANGEDW